MSLSKCHAKSTICVQVGCKLVNCDEYVTRTLLISNFGQTIHNLLNVNKVGRYKEFTAYCGTNFGDDPQALKH